MTLEAIEWTYKSIPLQSRRATVKDEDRLDSIKQELGDAAQESQDMCIDQNASFLVPHRCLKLVQPDA